MAATNNSNGTADITTGSSSALGNDAVTEGDAGLVINRGVAFAGSGGNTATGNASSNTAFNFQFALGSIAMNQAAVENHSNGTASITTGASDATGNQATTTLSQEDEGSDDPWALIEPGDRGSSIVASPAP